MSNTTYVATTAEGNTVARTSSTKDYNFVILAKLNTNGNVTEHDHLENAWGWSGDKINAEKAAAQAAKVYASVRVVAVEQKLTGKDAKLVLDAIKANKVVGSGSPYVGANTNTMGKPSAPQAAPAEQVKATTRKAKPEPAQADELLALVETIKCYEADLAAAQDKRNKMIANLISSGTMSGPKIATLLGMTPMGVYNAAKRA